MNVPIRPLKELVDFRGGGTPTKSRREFYETGTIPWVTPKDMKSWEIDTSIDKITPEAIGSSAAKLIPPRSVLIVVRSGVLKHTLPVGLNTLPVAVNQDLKALVCSEAILPEYLGRFLRTSERSILSAVRGTTADNVPVGVLKELGIPLPPLPEQKRIAAILDAADDLRAKRRESIAQLDSLLQSVFFDMFGDPVTNPKGWEQSEFGQVGAVQGGLQVTSKRRSLPLERPYLRVANVYRGYLELTEIKTIRLTATEARRTALQPEDILVVEGHGNKDEIGRCARWDGSIQGCVHQNHLIRVRCDQALVQPIYAEAFLNSEGGRRALIGTSRTTSGLNTISVSKVRSTPILMPPVDLQRRFTTFVGSVHQQKVRLQAHLAELDTLFASLQSRAFRGDL